MLRHFPTLISAAALFITLLCGPAAAHPMGPNSYNHYSAITVHAGAINVFYIMDIAEFPTYAIIKNDISRRRNKVWTDEELTAYRQNICPELARGLTLTVDKKKLALKSDACRVEILPSKYAPPRPGRERDLRALERRKIPWYTLWIELELSARFAVEPGRVHAASFEDANYADMAAGWREIELLDSDTAKITGGRGSLNQIHSGRLNTEKLNDLMLKVDKDDMPRDTSAAFRYAAGAGARTSSSGASRVRGSWLKRATAALPELPELLNSHYFPLAAMAFAFILGCLHALSPGHGKTLVAAYLIGSRGRVSDAVLLGVVVTVSHVLSVVALGAVIMLATTNIDNRRVEEFLQLGSGILIVAIGLWMFARNTGRHKHSHDHGHTHEHGHDHNQTHEHDHAHHHQERATWRDIFVLGVTGGIVPCPTALIVLFSAVALKQIGFGLALIAVFSMGLAAVLIAIGILMVKARGFMDKRLVESGAIRILPFVSAAIITAIGAAFIVRAAHALKWL